MAKILVPLKRVPDYLLKIKLSPDGEKIQSDGIKWILNPFDEIAVEEALRIKESRSDVEEIVVVSVGPQATTEQLRTALAMGADRAILVLAEKEVDSFVAHLVLAEIFRKDAYQIVIMGKQAIDSDANQTGQLLASRLGLAQATFASKVIVADAWEHAVVTREVDGGLETIQVALPAVVTTDLRLNEPRLASLPGIVKAKKKPLEEIPIESLGVDTTVKVEIRKMQFPAERGAGKKVGSVAELVQKLSEEAKVL